MNWLFNQTNGFLYLSTNLCNDYFIFLQGQHMAGKLGAVSSEDDEDDFSPYGETSRDEAKEGWAVFILIN